MVGRLMAQCSHCKDETDRYDGGDVPVCVECSDLLTAERRSSTTEVQTRITLFRDFLEATSRYQEASREFQSVMGKLWHGSPDPKQIKTSSRNLTILRQELMRAHCRLNEDSAASWSRPFPILRMKSGILRGIFPPSLEGLRSIHAGNLTSYPIIFRNRHFL